jgi:hypothetical protein
MRELTQGPERRLVTELANACAEERRMARQLQLHAERVPYPDLAGTLRGLAEQEEAHAALLLDELKRFGTANGVGTTRQPRSGRNYWERLTFDLEDLRAKAKRYVELAQHWDGDYPQAAALLQRLVRDEAAMCQVLGELIARSDPHAED